jgi:hypothetical protein
MKMTSRGPISKVLIQLLMRDDIPSQTVALVGEIITADARLSGLGKGKTIRSTIDAVLELTKAYEGIQDKCEAAIVEFSASHDSEMLDRRLSEIRNGLVSLY